MIDYSVVEQFSDFSPGLFLTLFVAALTYGLQSIFSLHVFVELVGFGLGAMLVLILLLHLFKLKAYLSIKLAVLHTIEKRLR